MTQAVGILRKPWHGGEDATYNSLNIETNKIPFELVTFGCIDRAKGYLYNSTDHTDIQFIFGHDESDTSVSSNEVWWNGSSLLYIEWCLVTKVYMPEEVTLLLFVGRDACAIFIKPEDSNWNWFTGFCCILPRSLITNYSSSSTRGWCVSLPKIFYPSGLWSMHKIT